MTQSTRPHGKPFPPELLAPAGSPEAFRAALAAGADAIYLGGKRFSARHFAQNFTEKMIGEAVTSAHEWGVSVYVTVNTLIHDRELPAVAEYLASLYSLGVDAILVQDPGVARLCREIVPGLPIHASTQMTVHNAGGVRAAAELGFSRVVLARECSLADVERIARETFGTGVGLEVFAHGALCFSYSGQCLLSSLIGGRSGNRGMCAQPCRMPYTLVTGEKDAFGRPAAGLGEIPSREKYLLSLKDLCTYPRLDQLVRSPVVSLKIEGRMKSPEYVAIVVAAYRRALDAIAEGSWSPSEGDLQDLACAFNRGFTDGWLFTRGHGQIVAGDQPDNRGLLIGTVEHFDPAGRVATIRLEAGMQPAAGDGLYIQDPDHPQEGAGFPLHSVPERSGGMIRVPVPRQVRAGSPVFVTSSVSLSAKAKKIMKGGEPGLRHPLPVDCRIRVDGDGQPEITGVIHVHGDRSLVVSYRPDFRLVPAKTHPLTAEGFRNHWEKTGGTPFVMRTLTLDYDGSLFAPVAEINRMRRDFLACARTSLVSCALPSGEKAGEAEARLRSLVPSLYPPVQEVQDPNYPPPLVTVYADTIGAVQGAASGGCDRICFEPDIGTCAGACRPVHDRSSVAEGLRSALAVCRGAGIPLAWKLPRITTEAELDVIIPLLADLSKEGLDACMVESLGAASAVMQSCPGMELFGGAGLNIFNHQATRVLAARFRQLTLSPELSGHEIRDLIRRARRNRNTVGFEMIVQGTIEAMIAQTCLAEPFLRCSEPAGRDNGTGRFCGLRDRTGRVFPLAVDGSCRTHILNADETVLIEYLPSIRRAGISSLAIDARHRTPRYAQAMAETYRTAVRACTLDEHSMNRELLRLRDRISAMSMGKRITGQYVRGLKET